MSNKAREAVEEWAHSLAYNEVHKHINHLELKIDNLIFANLERLTRWILGEYRRENFMEVEEEEVAVIRRKNLRKELIDSTLQEADDALLEATGWAVHPFKVISEDPEVQENLHRTTQILTTNRISPNDVDEEVEIEIESPKGTQLSLPSSID